MLDNTDKRYLPEKSSSLLNRKVLASPDEFIMRIIEMAPAVGVLLFVVIRQERRNDTLVQALVDCFNACGEDDDDDHA